MHSDKYFAAFLFLALFLTQAQARDIFLRNATSNTSVEYYCFNSDPATQTAVTTTTLAAGTMSQCTAPSDDALNVLSTDYYLSACSDSSQDLCIYIEDDGNGGTSVGTSCVNGEPYCLTPSERSGSA